MRIKAYKKSIDEARRLPELIVAYATYFNREMNVRRVMIQKVLDEARYDKALYDGEYVELYRYANENKEDKTNGRHSI